MTREPTTANRAPAAVEIRDLAFGYPGQGHRLDGVSLTLQAGEICCLLGPNGTGKTTLLRCLLGLLKPERGTILIQGQDAKSLSSRDLARHIAYVPQRTIMPFPFTALEVAVMGRTPHMRGAAVPSAADDRVAFAQLDRLGIADLASRIFSTLSGGEQQMVLLARALVQESKIMILDEPTAALDYGNEVRLLDVVSELAAEGRTILITTHQPAQALAYADRAVLMFNSTIVGQGVANDVLTAESLSALYGVKIYVLPVVVPDHPDRNIKVCISVRDECGPNLVNS